MADFDHKNEQAIIFHRIDEAIASDPNPVELIRSTEFF
jgi:hypothetical protein